jgi:hypothetical protein
LARVDEREQGFSFAYFYPQIDILYRQSHKSTSAAGSACAQKALEGRRPSVLRFGRKRSRMEIPLPPEAEQFIRRQVLSGK